MREAIGTSFVFSLMMTFVGILIAMFVGSIAYTKGFKVRNKIIDLIERNEGYVAAKTQIDQDLSAIGYRVIDKKCPTHRGVQGKQISDYRYCVYEYTVEKGTYYGVMVFIHFDVPLIGDYFEIPIYGESRLIFKKEQIDEGQA